MPYSLVHILDGTPSIIQMKYDVGRLHGAHRNESSSELDNFMLDC